MHDIRADFPILARDAHASPLVYLDNAATTQKPVAVIEAVNDYYRRYNANVHRAAHALAEEATEAMEMARAKVAAFIDAASTREIIFTRGTTESINLVAACFGIKSGSRILISEMEHHSNIVPWQMLAERTGAQLDAIRVTTTGDLDLEDFRTKLDERTALVAIAHVSNALGTLNDIGSVIADTHAVGAKVLIDGAQAVLHLPVSVKALDCDFYAFSAHKMFGPTGIGVLYGKERLLEAMPPWQGGGEMIERVTLEGTTYNRLPYKFEAGTPHIAGIIGLGAAIDYLSALPRDLLVDREEKLVHLAVNRLKQMPGLRMVGEPRQRISIVSFVPLDAHPHDVGMLLDQQGIAVRTGHHCAMPLMERMCVPGTVRASFSLYNSADDVDRLLTGVEKALSFV
ncbi:MAG: cysteine desulfurase [Pseudomonadales bacterium]|nr:cysteine desulfurase [Pseudomonadales bacterium]MDP6472864.1 cysteine desulfurase [Pseudomonadales bacterium]MDP6826380.1 cysteine desulfurase [Pseudomonadales bacterium]MDP6972516.1 cysteine desulfurase [Pseudomonadales bacterium]